MFVTIENVRLIPNASCGRLEEIAGEIYWLDAEDKREGLELKDCDSVLFDKLSLTGLLSFEGTRKNIKMIHFMSVEDVERLSEYTETYFEFEKTINGPYIQFNKQQEQQNQGQVGDLDEATLNLLEAFSKVPLLAKGLLSRLRGEPQNLRRPRGINKSKGIPVNPWILDNPLNLPSSRILTGFNLVDLNYEHVPKDPQVKAMMIYNSAGKLLNQESRSDFWYAVLLKGGEGEKRLEEGEVGNESKLYYQRENFMRIEKDLNRIGEGDPIVLNRLKFILQGYCNVDPEVGYVQGMSDLALPFAKLYKNPEIGSKCFNSLMTRVRFNFLDSPESDKCGISGQLRQLRDLVNETSPLLGDYLKFNRDCDNLFFAYRWLLVLFRREFPDPIEGDRLWDVMLAAEAAQIVKIEQFTIYMSLAMILTKKQIFMETCSRFEDLLKFFNDLSGSWNLDELLQLTDQLINKYNK